MVSVDWTLGFQIFNFLLLVWVLNKVLYNPIRGVLQQRKEKITGFEVAIDENLASVKEKEVAFSSGIKDARSKGVKERDALKSEASDEEKRIISEINKKALAELQEIRAKISYEAESVRKELQKETELYSKAICQKILGRAV